ncbi:hypothetical protein B296_00045045 [Ensete ventricosum]|uniref:Uncharacterized protein n=1 Tax=Ensete ventricosum TaxID=4639 RepID=A0A426YRS1_ENSVE|nr:hypothetical protein B296_00045045 [Ensete ventricosum]
MVGLILVVVEQPRAVRARLRPEEAWRTLSRGRCEDLEADVVKAVAPGCFWLIWGQIQWGVEKLTASSWKVVHVSSLPEGSQPSGPPTSSRDLVQMQAAHAYSRAASPSASHDSYLPSILANFSIPATAELLPLPEDLPQVVRWHEGGIIL